MMSNNKRGFDKNLLAPLRNGEALNKANLEWKARAKMVCKAIEKHYETDDRRAC
jgi:hypothetical protein